MCELNILHVVLFMAGVVGLGLAITTIAIMYFEILLDPMMDWLHGVVGRR